MEGVVTDGTAKRARIEGYTIAGKTGTSQKLINGRYSHSDHYASFVGFLPSRHPELAIVVVIDSAHGPNGDHGGMVAAPIFKNIAEPALRYLGVPPTINAPPPVLVARRDGTAPAPTNAADAMQPTLTLVTDTPPGTVPDLHGLTARDAIRKLVTVGMNARVIGDGFVASQDPAAGAPLEPDGVCRLVLERAPSRPSSDVVHQ